MAEALRTVKLRNGVREYRKTTFPSSLVFGNNGYAALRLVTCGGQFDSATGHYESNVVLFASLTSARHAG